jgi:hypothetical protein
MLADVERNPSFRDGAGPQLPVFQSPVHPVPYYEPALVRRTESVAMWGAMDWRMPHGLRARAGSVAIEVTNVGVELAFEWRAMEPYQTRASARDESKTDCTLVGSLTFSANPHWSP